MYDEAIKEYITELKENAKEARETANEDLFQAGRNLAFIEALGILRRYFMYYESDIELVDVGLGDNFENELL
ncbi:MAG: hypothetical protein FWG68_09395 [Defluviitaleaceae bacterium]|nr:hypothetical protein [Defluviitaleaceae bacterium]